MTGPLAGRESEAAGRAPDLPATADISGHGVAPRYGEDPFDRGPIRRMLTGQPTPDGSPGKGCRRRRESPGVGRVKCGGKAGQQVGVVGQEGALPGEHAGDVALCHIVKKGKHFVPDPVAAERWLGIGGILERDECNRRAQCPGLDSPQVEQRMGWGWAAQRRQPVEPRPADQVEQHRLGPVIRGVAGRNVSGKDAVAGRSRPRLKVGARVDAHRERLERGPESDRRSPHERRLVGASWPQTVIDVKRRDATPGVRGQHQER